MAEPLQELVKNASRGTIELSTNQIGSWNLRRLRKLADMTQERLAELMTHFGIPWSVFTVSDAELAVGRPEKGRKLSADELALLGLLFYVTPAEFLIPPSDEDLGPNNLVVRVGNIEMGREAYLTDVLLRPSGVAARSSTGEISDTYGALPQ